MKYLLIIGDGMADFPLAALGGQTPLERALIPNIDRMSENGGLGLARTVPEGFPPGSDTAIMSIFGCAPQKYYAGRAPLEAAAQGIALKEGDAAMRCNNVSLSDAASFAERRILSHCGGDIDGKDARELVTWLFSHPEFAPIAQKAAMSLFPTQTFRHIAVMSPADIRELRLSPPHDHLGETVSANLPSGCETAAVLAELLEASCRLLDGHPINKRRVSEGKLPANSIWFWAEGTAAKLPDFKETYGKSGAVISAVPLCHGIARLIGLDVIEVEGATGEWDTNYEGKVQAALEALKARDFAAVHLEGPDECSHKGELEGKLQAIEWLDSRVVAPIERALLSASEDFRMLILSDHMTLMEQNGAHGGAPVPYIIYDSRGGAGSGLAYTEKHAEAGAFIEDATKLMELLFSL